MRISHLCQTNNQLSMRIFYIIFLLIISSCSTQYQKIGYSGGYSERKISSDKDGQNFIVSFNGNGYTNHQKVEDFAFLRSAEIAIENDFQYFVVISKGQFFEDVTRHREPYEVKTTGNVSRYGAVNLHSTVSGGEERVVVKPSFSQTIRLVKEKYKIPPVGSKEYKKAPYLYELAKEIIYYDAQETAESIRKKYNIKIETISKN